MSTPTTRTPTLTAFTTYLTTHHITLHPSLRLRYFPSTHGGLGLAASGPIPAGTILFRVPRDALLVPAELDKPDTAPLGAVPEGGTETVGGTVRPHAKLAAHIAFDASFGREHTAWVATWPKLRDYERGMPILWPERTRGVWCTNCGCGGKDGNGAGRGCRCRCRLEGRGECAHRSESRFAPLPSPITGLWPTTNTIPSGADLKPLPGLLPAQQAKFDVDLLAARRVLCPDLDWASKDVLERWTWAWCSVNTRCFYFLPEGKERPEDADEAMVMGPGMDCFNHAAGLEGNEGERDGGGGQGEGNVGVRVRYGPEGFEGVAERGLEEWEEVFFSYGAHSNDSLMVEYGFLLGEAQGGNKWDGVGIDGLVLPGVSRGQREVLRRVGYWAECVLSREGVCWRSEVVARLLVAREGDWGRWEEGVRSGEWNDDLAEEGKVRDLVRVWVEAVRCEAENSLRGLKRLETKERWGLFVDGWQDVGDENALDEHRELERLADARYDLCIQRWQQILDTAVAAAKCV